MWTSNDYLPGHRFRVRIDIIRLVPTLFLILTGFDRVGWTGAKKLHDEYESKVSAEEKVCI